VQAIGISGQQHGFVPLDAKGEVIRRPNFGKRHVDVRRMRILTKKLGGEKLSSAKPATVSCLVLRHRKSWAEASTREEFQRLAHVLLRTIILTGI